MDCKKVLHTHMMAELTPIRTRAAELTAKPDEVDALLADGGRRARAVARTTIDAVRSKMGLDAAQ
jgi:tryptophanyl-tRNA synthetase